MRLHPRGRSWVLPALLVLSLLATSGALRFHAPATQGPKAVSPLGPFGQAVAPRGALHEQSPGPNYTVTLVETGLPAGTLWSGSLNTGWGIWENSTTTSMVLEAPDGFWNWGAWDPADNFAASPDYGWFTVNGSAITESVTFVPGYEVTFNETGLPQHAPWTVGISDTGGATESTTIGVTVADGAWTFQVLPDFQGPPYYGALPFGGKVVSQGAPVTVHISFLEVYLVNFTELNLPSRANWTISFSFNTSASIIVGPIGRGFETNRYSTAGLGTSLPFYLSNGTFQYIATAPNFRDVSGTLVVQGAGLPDIDLSFVGSPPTVPIWEIPVFGGLVVAMLAGFVAFRRGRRPKSVRTH